jgi:glyoxylase-like metal-dependent hydrolase (beta-lactamase superfamily II)
VIDPLRAFADRYVEDARSLGAELKYAIDTHVHADHVSGVRDVAGASDAEPVLPAGAIERGLEFDATTVEDGDELRVGDATLRAIHAPGHTGEMTAFLLGNLLFDGDLLFLDGVARPDLEVGDEGASDLARQLYRTLHAKVLPLSDDTGIAPGHYGDRAEEATGGGYVAPLGDLEGLRALSLSEDEFVEFVAANAPPQPANYEEIVEINLGRRGADDAEAFELELGPNNCAASASSD